MPTEPYPRLRAQRRALFAEEVCREVRWQLDHYGQIKDRDRLMNLLRRWLRYARKRTAYDRPKAPYGTRGRHRGHRRERSGLAVDAERDHERVSGHARPRSEANQADAS